MRGDVKRWIRGTYIGRVGDELAEEDLLVGVEGVDDEREQLVDLGLEGEGLRLRRHGCLIPELPNLQEAARVGGVFGSRGMPRSGVGHYLCGGAVLEASTWA